MTVTATIQLDANELSRIGLNLQAVINIKDLPCKLVEQLLLTTDKLSYYSQLVLIGNGGKLLWTKIKESGFSSENSIDDFSSNQVIQFFGKRFSTDDFELIFPNQNQNQPSLGLQTLGEIAGWHNPSPFKVGINQQWGSWFAYRAVVLVKSHYQPTIASTEPSPCKTCQIKPCIQICPANALESNELDLDSCIAYRKQDNSKCKDRCIARMACPVADKHQYPLEQIQYHYSLSMRMIENYK